MSRFGDKGATITLSDGSVVSIQELKEGGINLNIGTRGQQVQMRANATNDFDFVLVSRKSPVRVEVPITEEQKS